MRRRDGSSRFGGGSSAPRGCALLAQSPTDLLVRERVDEELPGEAGPPGARRRSGSSGPPRADPRDLSGGERQRLALAIVMAGRARGPTVPGLVCLDEPTRGMDRARKEDLGDVGRPVGRARRRGRDRDPRRRVRGLVRRAGRAARGRRVDRRRPGRGGPLGRLVLRDRGGAHPRRRRERSRRSAGAELLRSGPTRQEPVRDLAARRLRAARPGAGRRVRLVRALAPAGPDGRAGRGAGGARRRRPARLRADPQRRRDHRHRLDHRLRGRGRRLASRLARWRPWFPTCGSARGRGRHGRWRGGAWSGSVARRSRSSPGGRLGSGRARGAPAASRASRTGRSSTSR